MLSRTLFLLATSTALAEPVKPIPAPEKRPAWDQAAAKKRVQGVLDIENSGKRPWDDVPWETDPILAADRAAREQKPIFVFFFLKKNVGPEDAPC
jgi:hypothetical protein